jgi:hypothetical protein
VTIQWPFATVSALGRSHSQVGAAEKGLARAFNSYGLYANHASGATTGGARHPDLLRLEASGVTAEGGLGPWHVSQFMREQSLTVME